jgi:hypothetical protein
MNAIENEVKVLVLDNLSLKNGELFDVSVFYEYEMLTAMSNGGPDAIEVEYPVIQIISLMWNDLNVTKILSESERNIVERDLKMQLPLILEILW